LELTHQHCEREMYIALLIIDCYTSQKKKKKNKEKRKKKKGSIRSTAVTQQWACSLAKWTFKHLAHLIGPNLKSS
jgi:hypothetical protein